MNQETAHEIVEKLITAIQRFRSMNREELPEYIEVSEELLPWSLGDKCILPALLKMSMRPVTPGEMYNILYIAHHLEPTIAAVYGITHEEDLPFKDIQDLMNLALDKEE